MSTQNISLIARFESNLAAMGPLPGSPVAIELAVLTHPMLGTRRGLRSRSLHARRPAVDSVSAPSAWSSDYERTRRPDPVWGRAGQMGWLDADAILAYDAARSTPAATPEIETAIRAIAEKPHLAPLVIAGLLTRPSPMGRNATIRRLARNGADWHALAEATGVPYADVVAILSEGAS